RGPTDARLPRAAHEELRWARQLLVGHQGADDFPRDRLRQSRAHSRDGYHVRDERRARRHCAGPPARDGHAVPGRNRRRGSLGDLMAKKAWLERVKRGPKFKVRGYYRCQRCGRSRGTLRKFKLDRKSTRLNSSHVSISYAVFCLKKKKQKVD